MSARSAFTRAALIVAGIWAVMIASVYLVLHGL